MTLARTITWHRFYQDVKSSVYLFERNIEPSTERCFWDRTCEGLQFQGEGTMDWAGLVTMQLFLSVQYRWVEVDGTWIWLERRWQREKAAGPCCGAALNGHYYLGINFPEGEGTRRIHALWYDVDLGSMSSFAGDVGSRVMDSIRDDAELLDRWIDHDFDRVQ